MKVKLTIVMATLAAVLALAAPSGSAAGAVSPGLSFFTATTQLDALVHDLGDETWVEFAPAVYFGAPTSAFEVRVRRASYKEPIKAVASIGGVNRKVPADLLDGWYGFADAFEITWTDSSGEELWSSTESWCPNDGIPGRLSPNAATTSRFTGYCSSHPFAKGQRWGIERGWAVQALGYAETPELEVGSTYTFEVKLRAELGTFLGIPKAAQSLRFSVTAQEGEHMDDMFMGDEYEAIAVGHPLSDTRRSGQGAPLAPRAATAAPTSADALPDLVALPALGISTHSEDDRDLLDFGATVYNAGQAPLLVEGFRRGSAAVMDAHQFFYRDGRLAGSVKVGEMAFDTEPTHRHWHFRDFALYDLVDSRGRNVATSGKEAFCLAPTDGINLLQKGAVSEPGNSDLATACGDASSIWVREVLAAGWGDTYTQDRAGQSMDITDLPNGTYRIRITANPDGRLHETSARNNVSHRTVVLGGVPGERTVEVPPYEAVDSEAEYGFAPEIGDPAAMG